MMILPDYVQNTYQRLQADGLPGTLYDGNPATVNSFVAETDIPFGRVISLGSTYGPPTAAVLGGGTVSATAGYYIGSPITSTVEQFVGITDGSIIITIDGTARTLSSLDFSSVTSFGDVATVLTTALSTYGTVTYDETQNAFKVTSATTGSSSVIGAITDAGSGTAIKGLLGFDATGINVAGIAARSAVILGVSVRSLQAEAYSLEQSNITLVKVGDVGAYLTNGSIKVKVNEAVSGGGAVYYDTTTGEFYGTSAAGRATLGSSKFRFDCAQGQVAVIQVEL